MFCFKFYTACTGNTEILCISVFHSVHCSGRLRKTQTSESKIASGSLKLTCHLYIVSQCYSALPA